MFHFYITLLSSYSKHVFKMLYVRVKHCTPNYAFNLSHFLSVSITDVINVALCAVVNRWVEMTRTERNAELCVNQMSITMWIPKIDVSSRDKNRA